MHYEVALVPVLAGYWLITYTNLFSHPYGSKTYHLPHGFNLIVSETEAANRWALQNETPRGRILRESIEIPIIVEVIMVDGQSFIGFAEGYSPSADYEGDVSFVPVFCGHRDKNSKQLSIDKTYETERPRVVLLVDKIISISYFKLEAEDIQWNVP